MMNDRVQKVTMKNWKLPMLLNTPLRWVIALGLLIMVVETLIMTVIKDALNPMHIPEVYWDLMDPILLTIIISPVLYSMVFQKIQNEERFRQINASVQEAIVIVNEQGRFTDWNPAAQRMFQYSLEEAIGQQMHQLLASPRYHADAARGFAHFQETGEGPLVGKTREITAIRKDGGEFPIEISISALKVKGRWHTVGVIRDITERKQAELQLLERELQYRTLADSGSALIWTSGTDKLCDYFNQPWLKFTGRALEQELGNGWAEGVHPDDMAQCLASYVAAFDRREPFSMAYRLRHRDGAYRWIQDDGCPRYSSDGEFIGYIGYCIDITERKQVENKLAESERHFRAVAQSANDAIITGAGAGAGAGAGNIVGWNAAAERLFGYTEAEIIGQPVTVLIPERYRKLHIEGMMRVMGGDTPHVIGKTLELAGLRKDGSEFQLELSLAQWQAANGQFFTAMIRDITQRKLGEKKLQEMLSAANQSRQSLLSVIEDKNLVEDSLRKLSLAVEQSPSSIVITNLDANIEYANATFIKETGYSLAETIGQNLSLLHSGKTPKATYDDLWAHLTRGETWQGEFINQRKDGSEYIESALVSPVRQPDGRVTHYLAIKTDITEHKRMESELIQQLDELRRWHDATSDREGRILDIKHEVNELLAQTGQPPRYPSAEAGMHPQGVGRAVPVAEATTATHGSAE